MRNCTTITNIVNLINRNKFKNNPIFDIVVVGYAPSNIRLGARVCSGMLQLSDPLEDQLLCLINRDEYIVRKTPDGKINIMFIPLNGYYINKVSNSIFFPNGFKFDLELYVRRYYCY